MIVEVQKESSDLNARLLLFFYELRSENRNAHGN